MFLLLNRARGARGRHKRIDAPVYKQGYRCSAALVRGPTHGNAHLCLRWTCVIESWLKRNLDMIFIE